MTHDPRARRVAVVGAGPAGIHALDALICMSDNDYFVDLFDAVPAPIGLIPFGSTHRDANVSTGEQTWAPRLRLFGNVTVGKDITVGELTTFYDTVIVAGDVVPGRKQSLVVVGTNEVSTDVLALLREASDVVVSRTPVVATPYASGQPSAIVRLLKKRSVPFTSWSGWHRPVRGGQAPTTMAYRHAVVSVSEWAQRVEAARADTVVP